MSNNSDLVVLVNLGTPDAPTAAAVASFLREFLSDPQVVDWPAWFWQPVLRGIILRTRPRRVAGLYHEIWSEGGSPLESGTKRIAKALQSYVGSETDVRWAYRYGEASLAKRLPNWIGDSAGRIVVVPLFPQRTGSSSGTIVDEVKRLGKDTSWTHRLEVAALAPDDPDYIEALAERTIAAVANGEAAREGAPARSTLRGDEVDHLLLSFHGIPVRYDDNELGVYRSDCQRTVSALLRRLGWPREKATLCYQSRFGPERWLGPGTAQLLKTLPRRRGIRSLAIATPGFVTEGLETLEEIGRLGQSQFLAAGGERFVRIPAVDDHEAFIRGLANAAASK